MTAGTGADDVALARLTDDQRAADAAEARRREQWLHRQAAEGGTLAGVLRDLAERGLLVAVATSAGRTIRGSVVTVGVDFVGLRAANGERVLIAIAAITALRPEPGSTATSGDRTVPGGASLGAVLAELATGGSRVSVRTNDGAAVAGRLRAVGTDVLTLQGDVSSLTYIPLARVNDVVLG